MALGAFSGGGNLLVPLKGFQVSVPDALSTNKASTLAFTLIRNEDDLYHAAVMATELGSPTLLDVHADWCSPCLRMERETFSDRRVHALLANIQLLKADVTTDNQASRDLLAFLGIHGPPAILFFDPQGQEIPDSRITRFLSADDFVRHLENIGLSTTGI